MKRIAELVLEACFLKHIPRSGYQFLGAGRESVAEHVYCTTVIAWILAQMEQQVDTHKLISMCLFHDLAETRTGDLNYVQKKYVQANETSALDDALDDLPFAHQVTELIDEFNAGESIEAQLAYDADQLSLLVDLKGLKAIGVQTPQTWLPHVQKRLKSNAGRQLASELLTLEWDGWWRKIFVDSNNVLQ